MAELILAHKALKGPHQVKREFRAYVRLLKKLAIWMRLPPRRVVRAYYGYYPRGGDSVLNVRPGSYHSHG